MHADGRIPQPVDHARDGLAARLVAHRGCPLQYPENTLLGASAAADLGACYIEVDVQLTRDLTPILYHDGTLNRLSGQTGNVFETSLPQIQRTGAFFPTRFGDKFRGQPVSTLRHLLERLPDWHAQVFLELKLQSLDYFQAHTVVEQVVRVIQQTSSHDGIAAVISKSDTALESIRQSTDLSIGWVLPQWAEATERRAAELAPEYLFSSYRRLPESPADIWNGPWQWVIYTINDLSTAEKMFAWGLDLVETDEIQLMLGHFSKAATDPPNG